MGKALITLASAALLTLSLHAQEEFTFVGAGAQMQTLSFEGNLSSSDSDINTFSLQLGKQTRRARTTFTFDYTSDYVAAGLFIDYIPFDTLFGTPKVRPYIGLNTQYIRYDDDTIDEDGFGFGAQTGLIIYASETIDIDVGYRYDIIQNSDLLENNYGFSVSLHYFFE